MAFSNILNSNNNFTNLYSLLSNKAYTSNPNYFINNPGNFSLDNNNNFLINRSDINLLNSDNFNKNLINITHENSQCNINNNNNLINPNIQNIETLYNNEKLLPSNNINNTNNICNKPTLNNINNSYLHALQKQLNLGFDYILPINANDFTNKLIMDQNINQPFISLNLNNPNSSYLQILNNNDNPLLNNCYINPFVALNNKKKKNQQNNLGNNNNSLNMNSINFCNNNQSNNLQNINFEAFNIYNYNNLIYNKLNLIDLSTINLGAKISNKDININNSFAFNKSNLTDNGNIFLNNKPESNKNNDNSSCDVKKVLDVYFSLLMNSKNQINNKTNNDFIKENKNNILVEGQPIENINLNDLLGGKNTSIKLTNKTNQSGGNNITNNFNYVLNNYNLNISTTSNPNDNLTSKDNIPTPLNVSSNKNNTIISITNKQLSNQDKSKNLKKSNKCFSKERKINFIIQNLKSKQAHFANDLNLEEKLEKRTDKSPEASAAKKIKFTRSPFALEKNTVDIKLAHPSKLSEKRENVIDFSNHNKNKADQNNEHTSIKVNFQVKKFEQINNGTSNTSNVLPKQNEAIQNRKTISSKNSAKKKKSFKITKRKFNCYNEDCLDDEQNESIKQELEEYDKFYQEDLFEALKNTHHLFMKNNFPEMYDKPKNFYLNITMLNRKREAYSKVNAAYYRENYKENKFDIYELFAKVISNNADIKGSNIINQYKCKTTNCDASLDTNEMLNPKLNNIDNNNLKLENKINTECNGNFNIINSYNYFEDKASLKESDKYSDEIEINLNESNDSNKSVDKNNAKHSFLFEDRYKFSNIFSLYSTLNGIQIYNSLTLITPAPNKDKPNDNTESEKYKIIKTFDNLPKKGKKQNSNISNNIGSFVYKNDSIESLRFKQMRKIWDSNKKNQSESKNFFFNIVDEFLYKIEKYWPFGEFHWCQEYALEFLMEQQYNLFLCIQMIKNKDPNFMSFMRSI